MGNTEDDDGSYAAVSAKPYVFSTDHVDLAVGILDDAYATVDGYDAAAAIDSRGRVNGLAGTPILRELWLAASYQLRREPNGKPGCELGSESMGASYVWPPAIRDVADDTVDLWRAVAPLVSSARAIARFEDLLFVRRDGNGRDRALRAARAYIDVVNGQSPNMGVVDALLRAWTLARSVRDVRRTQSFAPSSSS
jgi:hypothetical protein